MAASDQEKECIGRFYASSLQKGDQPCTPSPYFWQRFGIVYNVCGYLQVQVRKRGSTYSTVPLLCICVYMFATRALPSYCQVIRGHPPLGYTLVPEHLGKKINGTCYTYLLFIPLSSCIHIVRGLTASFQSEQIMEEENEPTVHGIYQTWSRFQYHPC